MRVNYAVVIVAALVSTSLAAKPQSSTNNVSKSIRSVDFLNFTYKPSCTSGRVTTKSGKYDQASANVPVQVTVNDVIYGQLRTDGSEQAVVLTGCNLGGTGYFTEAFLFELRDGKPAEVLRMGGGDRAVGGIESVRVEGHFLKIAQQYGVAACCANYIETTAYELRGNRLMPTGTPMRVAASGSTPIKTLHFGKGSSSGTISGQLTGENELYSFRARAGQVLVAELVGDAEAEADIGLNIMDPDGMALSKEHEGRQARTRLPSNGLYTLVISSNQSNVSYTFNVIIR